MAVRRPKQGQFLFRVFYGDAEIHGYARSSLGPIRRYNIPPRSRTRSHSSWRSFTGVHRPIMVRCPWLKDRPGVALATAPDLPSASAEDQFSGHGSQMSRGGIIDALPNICRISDRARWWTWKTLHGRA